MIICAAIRINYTTVIPCLRHSDGYKIIKELTNRKIAEWASIETGFIDNENNFLTRKEAWDHAIKCGQLSSTVINRNNIKATEAHILFSEDLY